MLPLRRSFRVRRIWHKGSQNAPKKPVSSLRSEIGRSRPHRRTMICIILRWQRSWTITELSRYSSKYALTELLICGECRTPYRRCTWTVHGKKKVVWRCINRLDYGKKYCHNSPSIEESLLQDAITVLTFMFNNMTFQDTAFVGARYSITVIALN